MGKELHRLLKNCLCHIISIIHNYRHPPHTLMGNRGKVWGGGVELSQLIKDIISRFVRQAFNSVLIWDPDSLLLISTSVLLCLCIMLTRFNFFSKSQFKLFYICTMTTALTSIINIRYKLHHALKDEKHYLTLSKYRSTFFSYLLIYVQVCLIDMKLLIIMSLRNNAFVTVRTAPLLFCFFDQPITELVSVFRSLSHHTGNPIGWVTP